MVHCLCSPFGVQLGALPVGDSGAVEDSRTAYGGRICEGGLVSVGALHSLSLLATLLLVCATDLHSQTRNRNANNTM
jgi:hypothetical protein